MVNIIKTSRILIIGIIGGILYMTLLHTSRNNRHNDYVIKTPTEEFIVNCYSITNDEQCVYFTYDGHERTICGNYEIIK